MESKFEKFLELAKNRASMKGMDFKGILAQNEILPGLRLKDSTLKNVKLQKCVLKESVFVNANLYKADMQGSDLSSSNFLFANMEKSRMDGADFKDAILIRTNMNGGSFEGANFKNCKLNYAELENANLRGTCFCSADLSGASLVGANLENCDFTDADLSDAILSSAKIKGVNLRGAILEGASLERVVEYDRVQRDELKERGAIFSSEIYYSSLDSMKNCWKRIKESFKRKPVEKKAAEKIIEQDTVKKRKISGRTFAAAGLIFILLVLIFFGVSKLPLKKQRAHVAKRPEAGQQQQENQQNRQTQQTQQSQESQESQETQETQEQKPVVYDEAAMADKKKMDFANVVVSLPDENLRPFLNDLPSWSLIDFLDIEFEDMEKAHGFKIESDSIWLGKHDTQYKNGRKVVDGGHAHLGWDSWICRNLVPAKPVLFVKRVEYRFGEQVSDLYVNDRLVSRWSAPVEKKELGWMDMGILIPGNFIDSSEITIRQNYVPGNCHLSMFFYWCFQGK